MNPTSVRVPQGAKVNGNPRIRAHRRTCRRHGFQCPDIEIRFIAILPTRVLHYSENDYPIATKNRTAKSFFGGLSNVDGSGTLESLSGLLPSGHKNSRNLGH